MIKIFSIFFSVIAVSIFFYSNLLGMVTYLIPVFYLFVNLIALKKIRVTLSLELSEAAKDILMRYPHWYTFPNVSKDNGSAAKILAFFGFIFVILSYINTFILGIVSFFIAILIMLNVSRKIDPSRYIKDSEQMKAHEEIISSILKH